jgi:hypothetical protein
MTDAIDGCTVLVEVRTGRRSHCRSISRAQISTRNDSEQPFAITLEVLRYHRLQLQPWIVRIPDKQLHHLEKVPNHPGLYRLTSVLYLGDDQSEDTAFCARPPVIVSDLDLEHDGDKDST